MVAFSVVYLLIPTSNHNHQLERFVMDMVVYLLIPTSNHNSENVVAVQNVVVYLLIPTSNHNRKVTVNNVLWLYIF